MRLTLVRHCKTGWNRQKRIQGWTDIPLDGGGRADARVLAYALQTAHIDRIVCSPLSRALETALIIANHLEIDVTSDARLRECCFGAIEGHTQEEASAKFGDHILNVWEGSYGDYDLREYGGEDADAVASRHLSLVRELCAGGASNTLLVGHGRGLNTLLHALREEPTLTQGQWRTVTVEKVAA